MSDDRWGIAVSGTDRQWWNATGACGGCGTDECHPQAACTPGDEGCRYCPTRGGNLTPPAKKQPSEPDPNQPELFI